MTERKPRGEPDHERLEPSDYSGLYGRLFLASRPSVDIAKFIDPASNVDVPVGIDISPTRNYTRITKTLSDAEREEAWREVPTFAKRYELWKKGVVHAVNGLTHTKEDKVNLDALRRVMPGMQAKNFTETDAEKLFDEFCNNNGDSDTTKFIEKVFDSLAPNDYSDPKKLAEITRSLEWVSRKLFGQKTAEAVSRMIELEAKVRSKPESTEEMFKDNRANALESKEYSTLTSLIEGLPRTTESMEDQLKERARVVVGRLGTISAINKKWFLDYADGVTLLDNLYLSLHNNPSDNDLKKSIDLLYTALEKVGIRRIEAVGKDLDTHTMESIGEMEGEDGKVVKEIKVGYKVSSETVPIRVAQVIVGNGKRTPDQPAPIETPPTPASEKQAIDLAEQFAKRLNEELTRHIGYAAPFPKDFMMSGDELKAYLGAIVGDKVKFTGNISPIKNGIIINGLRVGEGTNQFKFNLELTNSSKGINAFIPNPKGRNPIYMGIIERIDREKFDSTLKDICNKLVEKDNTEWRCTGLKIVGTGVRIVFENTSLPRGNEPA
ncbi:MAG: nucleotide exchange factor GrpE [Candidatus Levyibacteriota bacterium]|jgi:hypothetical protein